MTYPREFLIRSRIDLHWSDPLLVQKGPRPARRARQRKKNLKRFLLTRTIEQRLLDRMVEDITRVEDVHMAASIAAHIPPYLSKEVE